MNIINQSIRYININKKFMCCIMSKDLLKCCIEIPNIQRIRDDDKVKEIIEYQKLLLDITGRCDFHGAINIHYCESNDRYFLLDGQHRFEALRKLSNNYNIELFVEVEQVDTMDNLISNYNIINKKYIYNKCSDSMDSNFIFDLKI